MVLLAEPFRDISSHVLLLTGTIDSGVYDNTGNLIKDIDKFIEALEDAAQYFEEW